MRLNRHGFTLAELLIALVILGTIATFVIPKVLQAQQNNEWKAKAKEAAGTFYEAFQAYKLKNTVTSATLVSDLMPYLNYVRRETAIQIDHRTGLTSIDCSPAWVICLRSHNGAIIQFNIDNHFGGTTNDHYILLMIDPDGKYSGNTTGPGKSMGFDLYYTGRMTDSTNRSATASTSYSGTPYVFGPDPAPDWFTWN